MTYDPDNWLISAVREIEQYVIDAFNGDPDVAVDMSFPDTSQWSKTTPLTKALVHLEQDDLDDPVVGFGVVGVEVVDELAGTVSLHEAAMHIFTFDVGVWVSAELGGETKRMKMVQVLKDLFVPAGAKLRFNEVTGGLQVLSFNGGQNEIDRINDLPVWRAMGMQLLVRCFSRHIPVTADAMTTDVGQDPHLTIQVGTNSDGTIDVDPVVTP